MSYQTQGFTLDNSGRRVVVLVHLRRQQVIPARHGILRALPSPRQPPARWMPDQFVAQPDQAWRVSDRKKFL